MSNKRNRRKPNHRTSYTLYFYKPGKKILIERPEKFGGNLNLTEKELVDIYTAGELHPMDLKNAVSSFLISYLASVREYMENN